MRQNPELAKEYPELQHVADSAAASQAKEAGNQAFVAKKYEEAVKHFSTALRLREDPIFYSNRAAAYHAMKRCVHLFCCYLLKGEKGFLASIYSEGVLRIQSKMNHIYDSTIAIEIICISSRMCF